MRSKTRLSSYSTKRGDNTVNLGTSRKTNARLARPDHGPAYQPVSILMNPITPAKTLK